MKPAAAIVCLLVVACAPDKAVRSADLYGLTKPEDYLTGRFEPERHPLFDPLARYNIPEKGGRHYLRLDAASALGRLYVAFRREHPKIEFWVLSSTRNWDSQKAIWDGKFTGRTLVEGKRLDKVYPDPLKRARKILEYSSMPGTSRHHWGTDFDINELYNDYYKSGAGKVLYTWMQKNAASFGFCQPYSEGREKGYREERWHWSYRPLSAPLLSEWKRLLGDKAGLNKPGLFAGSEKSGGLALEYVDSISADCR